MRLTKTLKRGIGIGTILAIAGILFALSPTASANTTISGKRDCDSTSVINCGALSTNELINKYNANEYGDLPAIFNSFGISSSDIASLNTKTVVGTVHADGRVYVDGKLIGVNAKTAGRRRTPNSVPISGANAYRRPPSDSFASSTTTIKIFVGYKGDTPSWAVISSCGNPLIWDSPNVEVVKKVAKYGSNNFSKMVSVGDGEKATFQLAIRETTGIADLQAVKVSDELPPGLTLVPGSIRVAGVAVSATLVDIPVGVVAKSATVVVRFDVVAGLFDKPCGHEELVNRAYVRTFMQKTDSDTATVKVSKDCPNPRYACEHFRLTFNDRRAIVVFTPVTANGAVFERAVIRYIGDGNIEREIKTTSVSAQGNVEGEYEFEAEIVNVSVEATVVFRLPNGDIVDVDCRGQGVLAKVTTPPPPPPPAPVIPNTGVGDAVAGVFASVAGIGAFAHRKYTLSKR